MNKFYTKPRPGEHSMDVFNDRYALKYDNGDQAEECYEDMWDRVAYAVGTDDIERNQFYDLLQDFKFIPGGRILYAAGQGDRATLANCYVLDIADTREDIFGTLGESMTILAKGGGVGYNFSNLRPEGMALRSTGGTASGPCSFITLYNAAARTIVQGGSRRAAQMGQLNLSHPELRKFIEFKHLRNEGIRSGESREWNHFNVSVAVDSSAEVFLYAVDHDLPWTMDWKGSNAKVESASDIWNLIVSSAWSSGDPGLFFLDRAQEWSNTGYCEKISATNPCGEIPLPDGGACFLGSMNIVEYMRHGPDIQEYTLDTHRLYQDTMVATRFMDNCVSLNHFPTKRTERGLDTRRMGIGVMGLADAAVLANVAYDSLEMALFTESVYTVIRDAAYSSSVQLSEERGSFPLYDADQIMQRPFIRTLPHTIQAEISHHGLRNGHLLTQAPTGTTSILAGVSSGLEPIFNDVYIRRDRTGSRIVTHPLRGHPALRKANDIAPIWHLRVQETAQRYIDQSVSKTINLPESATLEDVSSVYRYAFEHGFKGITVFRDGCFDGVLYNVELCPVCEDAGVKVALVKYDGCTKCTACDFIGSCDLK